MSDVFLKSFSLTRFPQQCRLKYITTFSTSIVENVRSNFEQGDVSNKKFYQLQLDWRSRLNKEISWHLLFY